MYKYINQNMFEQGVPARDLTQDEWDAIPAELQQKLLQSGMYEKNQPAKQKQKQEGE